MIPLASRLRPLVRPLAAALPCALVMGTVLLAGCGDDGRPDLDLETVTGTVTLDGTPVEGASVGFTPKTQEGAGLQAFGQTDANGNFTLKTKGQEGAVAALHAVTIVKMTEVQTSGDDGGSGEYGADDYVPAGIQGNAPPPPAPEYITPQKYSDKSTSGLSFEVKEGANVADFALTSGE